MTARIFFSLGKLERLQDLVASRYCVGKALHSWRELFEFVPAEVAVTSAGGQDQVIVGYGDVLPVRVAYEDTFVFLVHSRDLAQDDGGILLVLENSPDRKANLIGTQNRRRHLVEQGLKQVVIRAIDQNDFRGRILESLSSGQSAKTTADYNDSRLSHLLLISFRPCVKHRRRRTVQPASHPETAERKAPQLGMVLSSDENDHKAKEVMRGPIEDELLLRVQPAR